MTTAAAQLPRHEEELLWASVLGCDRKALHSGAAPAPSRQQRSVFGELVRRRQDGEPLQYLTGSQGFRNLELQVGPGVLVPRPETEVVVERCLQLIEGVNSPAVVDLGTGSGAIALAIATERPDSRVWAVDSSKEALAWARKNAAGIGAQNVTLAEGDFFGPLPESLRSSVDLAVSNPPYLSDMQICEAAPDVREHEPPAATVAGRCGLEACRRLAEESLPWLKPGGWLVLETWEGQSRRLSALLSAMFTGVRMTPDLTGKLRVAEGRRR